MRIESMEIFSDATDSATMRYPGRRYPGVLIQGDTLSSLCFQADEICVSGQRQLDLDTYAKINALHNDL